MVSVYDVPVHCESCDDAVEVRPPESRRLYAFGAALFLGVTGLGIGVTTAIAGLGTAVVPFTTLVGAYLGYRGGGWAAEQRDGVTCPACGYDFSAGWRGGR